MSFRFAVAALACLTMGAGLPGRSVAQEDRSVVVRPHLYAYCDKRNDNVFEQTDEIQVHALINTTGGLSQSLLRGPYDMRDGGDRERRRVFHFDEFRLLPGEAVNVVLILSESDGRVVSDALSLIGIGAGGAAVALGKPDVGAGAAAAGQIAGKLTENGDDILGTFFLYARNVDGRLEITVNQSGEGLNKEGVERKAHGGGFDFHHWRARAHGANYHVGVWAGPDEP